MRITDAMRVDRLIADLDRVRARLDRLQQQASSGRRVLRPSDDPVAAATAMRLRTRLNEIQRYTEAARQAADWVAATEEALASAEQILAAARDVVLTGANSSLTPEAQQALAAQLDGLVDGLVQVGNAALDGRYLFGGRRTTQAPFARPAPDTVVYQGDSGSILRGIAPGVAVAVNVPGDRVLLGAMNALLEARQRILAGDAQGLSEVSLPALDRALEALQVARTSLGALAERLDRQQEQLRTFLVLGRQALSAVEDADLAEVALRLGEAEAAYRAVLAVGARIVQPTLIDFLR